MSFNRRGATCLAILAALAIARPWTTPHSAWADDPPTDSSQSADATPEDAVPEPSADPTLPPASQPPSQGPQLPPCTIVTPLPPGIAITPPDPGLDPGLAAMSGVWEGNWGFGRPDSLPSRVIVEKIGPTQATIVYGVAGRPDGQIQPEGRRWTATVGPGARFEFGISVRFVFELVGGTTLSGLRIMGQTTLANVNMSRCALN